MAVSKANTGKTKPAAKTTAAKAPAAKKTATAKSAAAKKPSTRKTTAVARNKMSAEERYRMVEVAAYFLAERNNFAGSPVEYWSAAEIQITQLLGD